MPSCVCAGLWVGGAAVAYTYLAGFRAMIQVGGLLAAFGDVRHHFGIGVGLVNGILSSIVCCVLIRARTCGAFLLLLFFISSHYTWYLVPSHKISLQLAC
jgi:hypothetical protein